MSKFFRFLVLTAMFAIAMFSTSCKKEKDKPTEKTLVSIAVTSQPTKKTYAVGEAFDPAGMAVTATYSDQSTSLVTVTADMLAYDFSTAGTNKTVTITYEGKTATITGITVIAPEATLVSIAVTTQPAKKDYLTGEAFDPAGMAVTATYSDESTAPVTITSDMLAYDFSEAGENKTVTITFIYNGVTKTATVEGITVTAPEATLVSIAVTTQPTKKDYLTGEAFDPAGMTVTATYSDESTAPVNNDDLTFDYDFSTVGENKTVTVTYEDKTATVSGIIVSEPAVGNFCSGTGTSSDPYLICTAAQLARLAELVNAKETNSEYGDKYYQLTADIDLSDYGKNWNGGKGWIPVGTNIPLVERFSFRGHFDGNNHKVSGLYMNVDNLTAYNGLFGYMIGGSVKNLGVEGAISGGGLTGGLVGLGSGSITNCYAAVTVNGFDNVGGLMGQSDGSITNCYATGTVNGVSSKVGGLAGVSSGSINNCFSTGNVSSSVGYVGGIVGYLIGDGIITNTNGNITNCYTTGNISGTGLVGGIVGSIMRNESNVTNCYATGAVSGSGYAAGAGGLVGDGTAACIANGAALNPSITITAFSSIGRVAGNILFGHTSTNNVAWDGMKMIGGMSFGTGVADNKDGADITTVQAKDKATYVDLGWSFDGNSDASPWKMGVGDYQLPAFYWQTTEPAVMPEHLK